MRNRSKTVELWSGTAQYCLLVGNYNSATVILESLESPPITRLQATVSLFISCISLVFTLFVQQKYKNKKVEKQKEKDKIIWKLLATLFSCTHANRTK